jgi:hypothetical protein
MSMHSSTRSNALVPNVAWMPPSHLHIRNGLSHPREAGKPLLFLGDNQVWQEKDQRLRTENRLVYQARSRTMGPVGQKEEDKSKEG